VTPAAPTIERGYARLPHGQMHYATCGAAHAPVVLLLHQTPRSWAEYRAVLPLLGTSWRAIAMDTAGFGESDPVPTPSIEAWADAAAQLLAVLHIERCHVVGHHTGGVIAVELAARHASRVSALVLSSTPFTNAAFRAARAQRPAIDAVEPSADGSHLALLWRQRQAFYPADRPDLLHAFVLDALKVRSDLEAGHRAVAAYRMEDRIVSIQQPTLLIRATDDPFAAPHAAEWLAHLPQAQVVDIAGGMVPLPDQLPRVFADAVLRFLHGVRDQC
jgi:pimeloyl-ACP methyl ester carboxylesterase